MIALFLANFYRISYPVLFVNHFFHFFIFFGFSCLFEELLHSPGTPPFSQLSIQTGSCLVFVELSIQFTLFLQIVFKLFLLCLFCFKRLVYNSAPGNICQLFFSIFFLSVKCKVRASSAQRLPIRLLAFFSYADFYHKIRILPVIQKEARLLYRPPKVRPKNLTIEGRYFYG